MVGAVSIVWILTLAICDDHTVGPGYYCSPITFFCLQPLWNHKNTKMKHKKLLIYTAIIPVFSCLMCPTKTVSYEKYFSKNYLGWRSKKILGKKKASYEERFPEISFAKISLRKKKLEYFQPRNILAQNIPGDKRNILDHSLYNKTEISTR